MAQYNTRDEVPAIPNEVRRVIRRQPREPEVQQKPVVHLLGKPAGTGVWNPWLPVPAASQPSQSAHGGRTGAHPEHASQKPELGMIELWRRLKKRGYTRCPESLF